jgi:hydroxyacylglutathione hydrolase
VEMTPAGSRVWGMSVAPVPEPDGGLEHGETLDVGGLRIEVLHTPGHTPGSTCFLVPSAGLVMTGDTLFQGSIGRSDFPGGDGELLGRSIQQRLYSLADATRVLSGHGPATTIGREATSNPFVRRRA